MIARIIRAIELLSSIGGSIAAVLILAMLVLFWIEIGGRALFNWSTFICDEYSAYFLVGLAIGFAHTFKVGGHIRINFLTSRFSPKIQSYLELFTLILSVAFLGYFALYVGKLVVYSYQESVSSISFVRTPLFIPQSALLLGIILMIFQLITHFLKGLERKYK